MEQLKLRLDICRATINREVNDDLENTNQQIRSSKFMSKRCEFAAFFNWYTLK